VAWVASYALLPLKDNIPTATFPIVTVVIIVLNLLVYFGLEQGGLSDVRNEKFVAHYSFIPYELSNPDKLCGLKARTSEGTLRNKAQPVCEGKTVSTNRGPATISHVVDRDQPSVFLTIFTAMFMHGSLLHIGGNMLFLWIFGNNIEDSMGRLKFILFYLLGGIAASLAQWAIGTTSDVPTLGASGAIAAVLGGYALLYPRARVVTLIFIIFFVTLLELPALLVLGAWFLLQLLDASSATGGGGGVAYFAHIGGFAFGLLAIKLFASRYDPDYDRPNRLPVY
jgi:membrane associated rhomboid family serine protease